MTVTQLIYHMTAIIPVFETGVSNDAYSNPSLSSLLTNLTQLIGLPLQTSLGEKKSDTSLSSTITIKVPFTFTPQLILKIAVVLL